MVLSSTLLLRRNVVVVGRFFFASMLLLCSLLGEAEVTSPRKWDRGANTDNFSDAANWDNDLVPGDAEDVLLDHSLFPGEYTVIYDSNSQVKKLNSLIVKPGAGDSIRIEIPSTNTLASALTLSGIGGTALAIYDKGVFTNASGASSGTVFDIAGTGATLFIYNGGTYRHYSASTHASVVENLSSAAGTENGNWVFRRSSTTLSLSNRSYPNLILRCPPNQTTTSYGGSGSGVLTIRGNLIVAPKATFAPTLTGEIRLEKDVVLQGAMRFAPNSNGTPATGTLTLSGKTAQLINGLAFGPTTASPNYLSSGVTLKISNTSTAGVTLLAPMLVNGTLELTNGLLNTDATNLITLTNNATGGSINSFVNGPVARVVNTTGAVIFPVGRVGVSGAAYRPLTLDISTLATPTTFTAVQQEGAFDAMNLNGELKRVSKVRTFQVTPSPVPATGQFAGTITLSFGSDDFVTNPEASSLVIAKNSSSGWINIGHTANTGVADKGSYVAGTLTSAQFTSFSQFTLGNTEVSSSQNPLPVTLTSFTATRKANGVFLQWATATETDNSRFDLQRSTDGYNFETIATVIGQHQSSQAKTYTSVDAALPVVTGTVHYRLCQVDEDGKRAFSKVASVQLVSDLSIYPNPITNQLHIRTQATKAEYRIVNSMGQVVLLGEILGDGTIDVQRLPDGVYYLLLRINANNSVHKFIKQR